MEEFFELGEEIVLPNGVKLRLHKVLTSHAKNKGFDNWNVFVSDDGNYKEIVIFEENVPVYASQMFEDIACHIDFAAIAKDTKPFKRPTLDEILKRKK